MVSVLRPGQRILSIPGFGVTTSRRAVQSAAADWWAVAGKTCEAAYQPLDAASYAASKVNLVTPSTHDATNGGAYPTWDASGWAFAVASGQYLVTDLVPPSDQSWSMILRYSNLTGNDFRAFAGAAWGGGLAFAIAQNTTTRTWYNGGQRDIAGVAFPASGVAAIAGNVAYLNGSAEASTIPAGSGTNTYGVMIGAFNILGTAMFHIDAKIQALAIYSATLTAGEVATVSTAISLL